MADSNPQAQSMRGPHRTLRPSDVTAISSIDSSPYTYSPRQSGTHEPAAQELQWPLALFQPEPRVISPENVSCEFMSTGLTMVEPKGTRMLVDQAPTSKPQPESKLADENWLALIALHRTLLHEHHDFFLATQHPLKTSKIGLPVSCDYEPTYAAHEKSASHTHEPSRMVKHDKALEVKGRRFACWFCKRHGQSGSNGAACEGKGFDTVHRGKEHCYRRHAPHHQCPRCHDIFDSADDVEQHLSSTMACEARKASKALPINVLTWKQLRDLKHKRKQKTSDFEEWNRIYKMLFPDQTIIPSPYVGEDEDEHGVNPYFQAFIRKELTEELHTLFDSAAPSDLRDPIFKKAKIQEALDHVTTRYKKRRLLMNINNETHLIPNNESRRERSLLDGDNPQVLDGTDEPQSPQLQSGVQPSYDLDASTARSTLCTCATTQNIDRATSQQTGIEHVSSTTLSEDKELGKSAPADECLEFLLQFDTAYLIDNTDHMNADAWYQIGATLGNILPVDFFEAGKLDLYFVNASHGSPRNLVQPQASVVDFLKAYLPKSRVMARSQQGKGIDERRRIVIESYLLRYRGGTITSPTPLNVVIFTASRSNVSVDSVMAESSERLAKLGVQMSQINVRMFFVPSCGEIGLPASVDSFTTAAATCSVANSGSSDEVGISSTIAGDSFDSQFTEIFDFVALTNLENTLISSREEPAQTTFPYPNSLS